MQYSFALFDILSIRHAPQTYKRYKDICAQKINFMPHNIHIIKPHAIILNKYL